MTKPTRFLHTPGIGTTTYLISDTMEGRALAANTPEDSPQLRRQRRAARAVRPLILFSFGLMGVAAGAFWMERLIGSLPPFGLVGTYAFAIVFMTALVCFLYSKKGRELQEHLLQSHRDIAQPLRHRDTDFTRLPMTVRGVPTLAVLSRAADEGQMGAVYAELAHPGREHSAEIEAALADFTRP